MVDVHDKATRSKNMRAIATRDTAIEKRLASLLTGQGLAFRRVFRTAARQTYRQITGTERVASCGGIDHFFFRQFHRRNIH